MSPIKGRAALLAMLLAGCSNTQTANEENFSYAIARRLEQNGDLCLGLRAWPIDVDLVQRLRGVEASLVALEAAGLIRGEWMGSGDAFLEPDARVKRYTLTDAAAPYIHQRPAAERRVRTGSSAAGPDLCWGRKELDRIVDWSGPLRLGEYRTADVTYRYRIADMAGWALLPQVQDAFPEIPRIIERAATDRRQIVYLSPTGWEAGEHEE